MATGPYTMQEGVEQQWRRFSRSGSWAKCYEVLVANSFWQTIPVSACPKYMHETAVFPLTFSTMLKLQRKHLLMSIITEFYRKYNRHEMR